MRQICLFVFIFCDIYASFATPVIKSEISLDIDNLKNVVRETTTDLEKYKENIATEMSGAFREQGKEMLNKFQDIRGPIMEEMKTAYDELKEEKDKDIDSCYKNATDELDVIFEKIINNLGKCQLEAYLLDFEPVGSSIDFAIEMGVKLIGRYESAIENCELISQEPSRKVKCLAGYMPPAELLANALKQIAEDIKELALGTSTRVISQTIECAAKAVPKLNEESAMIKEELMICASKK